MERTARQRGDWELVATKEDGDRAWALSIQKLGRHIDGNFYSYRLAVPFLYLVVSDEPRLKSVGRKKQYVKDNPTHWHLVTIDVKTGDVVQDFSLGSQKLAECRIEDVDDQGLLIGRSNHQLTYFRRHQ